MKRIFIISFFYFFSNLVLHAQAFPMMFCPGSSVAILGGPLGYASYSWTAPAGYPLSVSQATLSAITITNAAPGNVYTLNLTSLSSSTYVVTYTLAYTPITIGGLGSSPTCTNGASGSATIAGAGSLTGYNYTWLNSSNSVVATTSVVGNLSAGIYSIALTAGGSSSSTCGSATGTVSINTVTPGIITILKPYCSTGQVYLAANGGYNFQWYYGSTLIPTVSGGTAPGYTVTSPGNGNIYWLSYISNQGCHDSVKFTLASSPPGNIAVSGNTLACNGTNNGTAVISLTPSPGSPPGTNSFYVFAIGTTPAYSSSVYPTSANSFTASGLFANGNYSASVFDGLCKYTTTFTINTPVTFNYTLSPSNSPTLCPGNAVAATITFSSPPGNGQYTYSWSPSTFLLGGTLQSAIIQPSTAPGSVTVIIYTVVVTPTNINCPFIKTLTITAVNPVTPTIAAIPYLCTNSAPYTISVNPPGGTFFGGPISTNGVINPTITPVGSYLITYANTQGTCVASTNGFFVLNAAPNLNPIGSFSICSGQTTTLGVFGANSYSWSTGSTSPSIAVSPNTTTTYAIIGNNSNGCSTGLTLTVNVALVPSVTITGPSTLCSGYATTLTANGANTFSWSNNSTGAIIVVSPGNTSSYTVTGANSPVCMGTAIKSITVLPSPPLTVSGNLFICAGNSTTLTASGASTYSWNTNTTNASITVSPINSTIYTVAGTHTVNSCITISSASVNVTQYPVLTVLGNTSICNGQFTTLLAGGANTYTWNNSFTNPVFVISPSVTSSYSITGSNAPGNCSAMAIITVSVLPTATLSISGDFAVCAGQPATLTASGANLYSWSNNINGPVLVVTPSVSSSYTVTGSNPSFCPGSTSATISILPSPTITVTGHLSICAGQLASIYAGGADTYSWSTNATGSLIVISPTGTSTYTVVGTNAQGCSTAKTHTIGVSPCTGVDGLNGDGQAKIYPNPANDKVTIDFGGIFTGQISLYNAIGQFLINNQLNETERFEFDLSSYSEGVYLVKISSHNAKGIFVKLVKE